MRIGSFSNGLAIQKFDKIQQRAIVQKHIPEYIQIMLFDLNYPNPTTLHVEGTIVGTSTSDLATKLQQFRAVVRQKKVVWIDASDAYQGRLDLVRIIKRQGPTIDSNQGMLTATFQLDAQILPPWGTTHTNPWRQNGIFFRDLNNVGREYAINPLMNHCNFTIDETSTPYYFSWEFIVDNQNPFTNATSVQEVSCDILGSGTASATNPIATNNPGFIAGQVAFGSISIDTGNKKEGSGSIRGNTSSPTALTQYVMGYDVGSSGINISSFDRVRMWYECDQVSQNSYGIQLIDTSNRRRTWSFALQAASTWMNPEFAIASYSSEDTGFDITQVRYFAAYVQTAASSPTSINLWIDDIRIEIGYVSHCEDTNGWSQNNGSGLVFSNDATIYREGLSSLKVNGTSDNSGNFGSLFSLPVSSWNLTSPTDYDFFMLWVRCDFGGNSTGALEVQLKTDSSDLFVWDYANLNANQWYRIVLPLRNPTSNGGSPNLDSISSVLVRFSGRTNSTTNSWIDEIAVDVGRYFSMESNIPDNVSQTQPNYTDISVYSWKASAYGDINAEDPYGNSLGSLVNRVAFLDGVNDTFTCYPSDSTGVNPTMYAVNSVGNSAVWNGWGAGATHSITYTRTYGCKYRFAFNFKIPPATSDSSSGNYPSNDLSGFQAINKVRLKIQIYFSNDDTSYSGM